jgi:hypothetical protein
LIAVRELARPSVRVDVEGGCAHQRVDVTA